MIEVQGKYNKAKIFTDNVEETAMGQIIELCNQEFAKDSKIRIMPDCLTEDTEVLTDKGFVLIKELEGDERVANYVPDTEGVFFSPVKKVIRRELREGEKVYSLTNNQLGIDITTTENHRNAYRRNLGELTKDIPEVTRVRDYVWGAKSTSEGGLKLTDGEIRLLVWIIGDGNIKVTHNDKSDNYRIRFGLKKERKLDRLKTLLNYLHVKFTETITSKQTELTINTEDSKKWLKLLDYRKQFKMEWALQANTDQATTFIEEAIYVDGDYEAYQNSRGFRINSTDKTTVDFFSALVSMHIGSSNIKKRSTKSFGEVREHYYINITPHSKYEYCRSGLPNKKINKEVAEYKGEAVCIQCDTGYFVARQKGRTFVTGNCHAGAGCTIGTTMTIKDKVVANLVGVDIGCGLEVAYIDVDKSEINFDQLDEIIRKRVPSGFSIRSKPHMFAERMDKTLDNVIAPFNKERAMKSIGTLGGGNHFIELNEVEPGQVAIVIHSGSRNLGKQVAEHYQNRAYEELMEINSEKVEIIAKLKAEGREKEIQEALREVKKPKIKKDLAYLEGDSFNDYLHDMKIAQEFAARNRKAMVIEILEGMGWIASGGFTTIHNYIDMENMILRKGAISTQAGERVIIPINMKDGSIIATGKGNPDWNFSGPHGAGRVMSRSKAKLVLDMQDFEEDMSDVWTTSVSESTIDEAPRVYKPMEEIISNIGDAVTVDKIIKPLYNFKAN